jgi:hypothetical protein
MDEFQDIVKILKSLPRGEPLSGFTSRVVSRIQAEEQDFSTLNKARMAGWRNRAFSGLEHGSSCPLWFLMAGFCYMVLGVVLYFGLSRAGADFALARWVAMQPQVAFVVGGIFFILGLLLVHGKLIAVKTAKLFVLIYMGFVIINGIGMQSKIGLPVTAMLFLFYIGCGVALGFFLQETIRRYHHQLKQLI